MTPFNIRRSAVGPRDALSARGLEEIRGLSRREPVAFLLQLLLAWSVIAAAVAVAKAVSSPWITALSVFVIATRQNLLGLLVHEQAHCLAFRARFGDLFVNLTAAYPLLVMRIEGYAPVHLAHHARYFTPEDPDHLRKSGEDWATPMKASRLLRLFLTDLLALNVLSLIRGKNATSSLAGPSRSFTPRWLRPAYYLAAAAALTATGHWIDFLLFWVLPAATITQALVRLGAITEHYYNRPGATVEETSPLILPTWWERLLLPNLNFTYHPYHHFFPGVPFCHLPKVHRVFQREGLVSEPEVFHGYLSFFRHIQAPTKEIAPMFSLSSI